MPTPPDSFDKVDGRLIATWDAATASPPLALNDPPCDDESAAIALREQFYVARRLCPVDDPRYEGWWDLLIRLEGDDRNVLVFRKRNDHLAILDQIQRTIDRRRRQR